VADVSGDVTKDPEVLEQAERTSKIEQLVVVRSREQFERAKDRLASVDVVGLQEDFEPFCSELEDRFGWDLGEPVVANDTPHEEVSNAFRARIAPDSALDVELYEFARDLVANRRRDGAARP